MIDPHFYALGTPITLRDLADRFGADLPSSGSADELITSASALAVSQSGDVTFYADTRLKSELATARATACLTTQAHFPEVAELGMIAIICKNPRTEFAKLTDELVSLGPQIKRESDIHPTANVHPSAVIGDGVIIGPRTKVGANSVIEDGVEIGSDGIIEASVCVSFSIIGDHCHLKSGAIIGGSGFGVVNDGDRIFSVPHFGRVLMGDRVHIGANSCVDRGQLGDTIISNDVKIDNLVQVGHNVFIDEGALIAGHSGISGSCNIGKRARLAGRASLADHISIGDGATLAVNSLAIGDVPAGETYFGNPAMPIKAQMRHLAMLRKLTRRK